MEKNIGNISVLPKTNTFNFYMKKSLNTFFWMTILVFVGFWIEFGSRKLFFWTNIFNMVL